MWLSCGVNPSFKGLISIKNVVLNKKLFPSANYAFLSEWNFNCDAVLESMYGSKIEI